MSNPLLELMRQGESGAAGYNAYNRGTYTGSDGKQHIRGANGAIDFSQFTLEQVQDLQHLGRQDPDRVFAIGKYQIIPTTMDRSVEALGLDRSQRFTPQLQDKIFSEYLIVDKRPAVHDYITGEPGASLQAAQKGLAMEWASFGDPDKGGRSYYGGANRASITLEQSASALNQMREEYKANIDKGVSPDDAWKKVTASGNEQTRQTAQPSAQPVASTQGPRSFDDVMKVMLPPQNGVSPHVTGHYGEHRDKGDHGGVDFNYVGGQTGINKQHPTINAPISGKVTFVGGQYGTIKIEDAQGNSHEILHTQSQSVKEGQQVTAGQPIGTMGGRGPDGANDYAQHVHYQLKDSTGKLKSPEDFWNKQQDVAVTNPASRATEPKTQAASDGVIKHGEKGESIRQLQDTLNNFGYRDKDGRALREDGGFGDRTKEAVQAYQQAHGLKADGVVGPQTLEALKKSQSAPLLSDSRHPDNALYQQAVKGLEQLGPQAFKNRHELENAAGATVFEAKASGLTRIDHVLQSTNGTGLFAVQGAPNDPAHNRVHLDKAQAAAEPIEKSTAQVQQEIQPQPQVQQEREQRRAVAM
ncbi:XVIPCD domain-containing protein [Pseudoxanthomonas sacheonensis]|uniref:Murein DD-endopeptidase MepM/ murein hydrolase activator NlpD n=1 Tax=Pseudoxanthomonas sacheonensis TaxID=443615 RepID=A0ABU1RWW1_9GAMM|nr:XVIPCD domain-containing protein [Pseudoxanthomonas sacheonensis]MDR6843261.1 murein DD-endopeptidase MepM/ murein hydrolase activator NlpD [Pseudoxanthomonas sacheonensis]